MPLNDRLCLLDTETLAIEDITVAEGASHYWSAPLEGGRIAALVNTRDRYGLNQNPSLYLRENGAWRPVLADGAHCFGNSVGSDIKPGQTSPATSSSAAASSSSSTLRAAPPTSSRWTRPQARRAASPGRAST